MTTCPHCGHPHAHERCTLCPGEAHGCPLYAAAPRREQARDTADALTGSPITREELQAMVDEDAFGLLVANVAALAEPPLTDAERFFYKHAGALYNPATETYDAGRLRGARALAAAEARLHAGPYYIGLEPDPTPWDGDEPWDGPLFIVCLWSCADAATPRLLGALGSVAVESEDAPYIRVVSAELAAEHIPPVED